jgi:hypothetical protein
VFENPGDVIGCQADVDGDDDATGKRHGEV